MNDPLALDDAERYGRHSYAHALGPDVVVLLRRFAVWPSVAHDTAVLPVALPKRRPRRTPPSREPRPPVDPNLLRRLLVGLQQLPSDGPLACDTESGRTCP